MVAAAAALVAMAACGGGTVVEPDALSCEFETRAEDYRDGLEKVGAGGMRMTLVSSDPAPPIRGENAWTLSVAAPDSTPVEGAALEVFPFMPDFDHGTPMPDAITESGGGVYVVEPVVLFKAGLWEITVRADDGDGLTDEVLFRFCVDG